MNARRVALQGLVGAGALAIAVQGFLPLDTVVVPPVEAQFASGSGPDAQVSLSDWLRRRLPPPMVEELAADPIAAAKAARRARRRREEMQLLTRMNKGTIR